MTVRVRSNGSGWRVTENGTTVSNHRKKKRAVKKAKSTASSGEQLVIHRANGTIQDRRRVR